MKKNTGITLVALVITVIIIIILATVAISFTLGNYGLLGRTQTAKAMYANDIEYTDGSITNVEAYINDILINDGGKGDSGTEEPEPEPEPPEPQYPTIEETLKEGDFVEYVDGTGQTRECIVLYGPENANYADYGIQIITTEIVENVPLGSSDFTTSMNSYNGAIATLNEAAQKYKNSTYASVARSVGSVPDEPDFDEAGMHTPKFGGSYSGLLKDVDDNYLSDWEQMNNLTIYAIGTNYWLASRGILSDSINSYFYVRNVQADGTSIGNSICHVKSDGSTACVPANDGLRPVFTLNAGLKVTGGSGEDGAPYTLGV